MTERVTSKDVYSADYADSWAGVAPFRHASGIWGRGRFIAYLSDQLSRGETVIDLGCGAGLATSYLCPLTGPDGEVKGYDSSQPLVDIAKDYETIFSNLTFEHVDVGKFLPDSNESVDWYVSFMLLQNLTIKEIDRMLEECKRCLRPSGALAFLTLHPNFFEEDWDLTFVRYDELSIRDWRENRQNDLRIEGWLESTDGSRKPAFAFPHSRADIVAKLVTHGLYITDEINVHIDVETAVKRFGPHAVRTAPSGPLFWMFKVEIDRE